MRARRRTWLVLLALLAAVVVAVVVLQGRGDEGEQVTQAGLVERANGICARLSRENRALEPPPRPYDHQSADFFAGVHENVADAKDAFGDLRPPPGQRPALDRLVQLYGRIDVRLDQVETAAAVEQDPEVITLFQEIDTDTTAIADVERELGICAGRSSARQSISAVLRRTRPNPLTVTGEL